MTIENSHGDFPAAMKALAEKESIPCIDLTTETTTLLLTLGVDESTKSLVHYPAGVYSAQELEDNTHWNPYGAYEISKMVVMGLKSVDSPLVKHLRSDWTDFSSGHPDSFNILKWYDSAFIDPTKPAGNYPPPPSIYFTSIC